MHVGTMLLTLACGYVVWRLLCRWCNTASPVVVVLSGSMEPTFYRGDLLFLTNHTDDRLNLRDVVVFNVKGRPIPIVHRIIDIRRKDRRGDRILTKGDNNAVDDVGLYSRDQPWVARRDVVGRARFTIPQLGHFTLFMNENPTIRNIIVAAACLYSACSYEDDDDDKEDDDRDE